MNPTPAGAPAAFSPFGPDDSRTPAELNVADIWRTLVRRRGLFTAIFLGVIALVVIGTLLVPKSYTTEAKLVTGHSASGGASNTDVPLLNAMLQTGGINSPESYVELINQEPVARRVRDELHLDASPRAVLGHLKIRPVTNTTILKVDATWSDPQTSAAIANKVGEVFVVTQRELLASQMNDALKYLDAKLPKAATDMHVAERNLQQFQSRHRIADLNGQTQSAVATLNLISQHIGDATSARDQARAQLASVQAALAHTTQNTVGSRNIAANPVAAQAQQRLAQVDIQLQVARQQYTEDYPAVIALKNEQRQLQAQIAALPASVEASNNVVSNPLYQQLKQQESTLAGQVASNNAAIAALHAQERAAEPLFGTLPQTAMRYQDLARSAKSNEDFYNALKKKRDDAAIARDAVLSDVAVAAPASAAFAIVSPNLKQNLMLAIVAGLLLAIGGIILVETLDQSMQDEDSVTSVMQVPILATIPGFKEGASPAWLRSMWTESFVQLMSGLRYSTADELRTISITSPSPGDGKSLVALNAAIALGEIKPNILLVDADMRRSNMDAKIGVPRRQGLSEVLVGLRLLDEVIQKSVHPGLDYLSAGARPPNPAKLLESTRFEALIAELKTRYELIIIDTPALAATFDGNLVSAQADGTLMVISAGKTHRRVALRMLERLTRLRNVNFLGAVLNRTQPSRSAQQVYMDYMTTPSDVELQTGVEGNGHTSRSPLAFNEPK